MWIVHPYIQFVWVQGNLPNSTPVEISCSLRINIWSCAICVPAASTLEDPKDSHRIQIIAIGLLV